MNRAFASIRRGLNQAVNRAIEAKNLQLRADLIFPIVESCRESGATRSMAAKKLGLTQPRLNALMKGRLRFFSLDLLVAIASRAG